MLTVPTETSVHCEAVRAAFAEFDVEPTTEGRDGVVRGSLTRVRRVCDVPGLDPVGFWPRHEAYAAAQREALERGVKTRYDDFEALRDLDVPLAVVSNDQQATVEHVVEVFGLDDLFEVTYGREPTVQGLRRTKPSAHYIERALSDLGVESALYVGDGNVDVLAADRANIDSAFVHRPHRAGYALASDPTYELESLHDLSAIC